MDLLAKSFSVLPPPLRLTLVKSLVLLHNRGRLTSLQASLSSRQITLVEPRIWLQAMSPMNQQLGHILRMLGQASLHLAISSPHTSQCRHLHHPSTDNHVACCCHSLP